MSWADSVKIGAMKAVLPLAGTVVASDAFPSRMVEEAAKWRDSGDSTGRSVNDTQSRPPTGWAWRWYSQACGTSGIDKERPQRLPSLP
jgi:hypothetical protein